MKSDAIITGAVFLLLLFMMAQIRIIRLLRKMSDRKISGGIFLVDVLGCCCESCEICYDRSTDRDVWKKKSMEEMGYVEERAPDEYEIKTVLEASQQKEEINYQSEVEEQIKVLDLVSKREKTGIMYVRNKTKLPKERIIEIIDSNPNFFIENEFILKKKKLAEVTMKEITDSITKKNCPNCNTPIEAEWDYCSNCSSPLK